MIDFCHRVCEFARKATASCSQTNCHCQMAKITANTVALKIMLGEISHKKKQTKKSLSCDKAHALLKPRCHF